MPDPVAPHALLSADVLVIGGGPAGTWAAIKAAQAGAAVASDSRFRDVEELTTTGLLGGYRRELGWGHGRKLGARTAIGPEYPD
jgi:thioredoxin reductase